jgi:hypothetical protein
METGWRSEEGKMKPASALGVIGGQHTWLWRREPWGQTVGLATVGGMTLWAPVDKQAVGKPRRGETAGSVRLWAPAVWRSGEQRLWARTVKGIAPGGPWARRPQADSMWGWVAQ